MLYAVIISILISIFIYMKLRKIYKVKNQIIKRLQPQVEVIKNTSSLKKEAVKLHSTSFLYGHLYKLYLILLQKEELNDLDLLFVKDTFIKILNHNDFVDEKTANGYFNIIYKNIEEDNKKYIDYFEQGCIDANLFWVENCISNSWKNFVLERKK